MERGRGSRVSPGDVMSETTDTVLRPECRRRRLDTSERLNPLDSPNTPREALSVTAANEAGLPAAADSALAQSPGASGGDDAGAPAGTGKPPARPSSGRPKSRRGVMEQSFKQMPEGPGDAGPAAGVEAATADAEADPGMGQSAKNKSLGPFLKSQTLSQSMMKQALGQSTKKQKHSKPPAPPATAGEAGAAMHQSFKMACSRGMNQSFKRTGGVPPPKGAPSPLNSFMASGNLGATGGSCFGASVGSQMGSTALVGQMCAGAISAAIDEALIGNDSSTASMEDGDFDDGPDSLPVSPNFLSRARAQAEAGATEDEEDEDEVVEDEGEGEDEETEAEAEAAAARLCPELLVGASGEHDDSGEHEEADATPEPATLTGPLRRTGLLRAAAERAQPSPSSPASSAGDEAEPSPQCAAEAEALAAMRSTAGEASALASMRLAMGEVSDAEAMEATLTLPGCANGEAEAPPSAAMTFAGGSLETTALASSMMSIGGGGEAPALSATLRSATGKAEATAPASSLKPKGRKAGGKRNAALASSMRSAAGEQEAALASTMRSAAGEQEATLTSTMRPAGGKQEAAALASSMRSVGGKREARASASSMEDAGGQAEAAALAMSLRLPESEAEDAVPTSPRYTNVEAECTAPPSPSLMSILHPTSPRPDSPSILVVEDGPRWSWNKPLPKPQTPPRSPRPRTPPKSLRGERPVLLGVPEPLSARARCGFNEPPLSARMKSARGPRPGARRTQGGA